MKVLTTYSRRWMIPISLSIFVLMCFAPSQMSPAQDREHADEIVANLAGGRVIVHVARDKIVFAAIDLPVEPSSIPPRVLSIDRAHIGILLGASEWRIPADPKPVRLDKDFPQLSGKDPHFDVNPDEVAPDLDVIGVAFLERLRPLVSQLHHKIEFKPDEAIFEVVLIGFAPNDYGPEVWSIEYRIQQDEIATRGDYWQTRLLRPRFTQLYPPEKHNSGTDVATTHSGKRSGTREGLSQRSEAHQSGGRHRPWPSQQGSSGGRHGIHARRSSACGREGDFHSGDDDRARI
jgi:hypothetical protein